MDPAMYALIEPTMPSALVAGPSNFPVYNNFATEVVIKMMDKRFEQDKNYYLSYMNTNRACFCMLNKNIADQFKVSNTPNIMGWSFSMSICLILEQLKTSYSKPDTMSLFHNNRLFGSPVPATKATEMLFYQIEQCQEIQTITQKPYTPNQIIGNAVRILMLSGIFPLKEFDTWEAVPIKSYPILKTFIHKAYTRCLTAIQLCNTAGQQGCVQHNIYNILDGGNDDDTNNANTMITQTAVAETAGSTLGNTYPPPWYNRRSPQK
jgi:hypothetical protein